ncbi:MAG: phospholipid carrier-dependent glycosyltransferase [Chloroflexi bacterium]|nr:phospholipid carrier-dependent glycosyltransferase [Chloroflexota bacterium]
MRDRFISIVLFVVVASIYFATTSGITSSHDGSHYALLRARADEQRWTIETYADFMDDSPAPHIALRNGQVYSAHPPGTALLARPFYAMGGVLPGPASPLPSRHDGDNPRLVYVMLLPVLAGAGTVVLLYYLLRYYDLSRFAALTTALTLAFGSTLWKYSSVLYAHALAGFLVMLAIVMVLRVYRARYLDVWSGIGLGLALGTSVLVEYANLLFVLAVCVYLIVSLNRELITGKNWWLSIALLIGSAALPLALLVNYNMTNFGGPFMTSYNYAVNAPWAASLNNTFDFPFPRGLVGLLWFGRDGQDQINQGLLLLMPVTALGLTGIWSYFREHAREGVLVVGVFAVYLLLYATHHTFSGFTGDGRYLLPFLALLFIPIGFSIDDLYRLEFDEQPIEGIKAGLMFITYGLIFFSVRNQMTHINFSANYELTPILLDRTAATPANLGHILGNLFVNTSNLILLWLILGVAIGAMIAVFQWGWVLRRQRIERLHMARLKIDSDQD